jgi:hypothetical protein
MSRHIPFGLALSTAVAAGLLLLSQLGATDPSQPAKEAPKAEAKAEAPAAPVKPKPISETVKKGLAYLINQQHADGGWGQGGGWRQADQGGGRVEGANVADPSDVADTCMALLALIRAGHTPKEGEYAKQVARGVDFVLTKIEKADKDSLYVTDVRNTQIQVKIGPYVDTFMAQLVMAELKGKMPNDKDEKRLVAAFDKTMAKLAKHQDKDGNFAKNEAWASTLSMALCSKGINRAAQNGFLVPQPVLAADQKANTAGLDVATGRFAAPAGGAAGDAGIQLYSFSGKTAGLQEAVNTLKKDEEKNRKTVDSPTAPKEEKEKAKSELTRLEDAEKAQKAAVEGLINSTAHLDLDFLIFVSSPPERRCSEGSQG